jgi:hypothetical protein
MACFLCHRMSVGLIPIALGSTTVDVCWACLSGPTFWWHLGGSAFWSSLAEPGGQDLAPEPGGPIVRRH